MLADKVDKAHPTNPDCPPTRNVVIAAFEKQKALNRKTLVAGASGRMAAEMLTRLGFECSVADLYGDWDTNLICDGRVTRLERLEDLAGKESLVRGHEFIVFAGGLEGCASLAEKLGRWAKPVFTSSESLERLADYRVLNQAMSLADVDRFPFSQHLPSDEAGKYVLKNLCQSCTARYATSENRDLLLGNGYVVQEYIFGDSISVTFVAGQGSVKYLGETKQLVEPMNDLMWSGSIAGVYLDSRERVSAMQFAESLTSLVGMVGVFGIDFVRTQDGIWPVDINPRIPASAEVVGDLVMRSHLKAFGVDDLPTAKMIDSSFGKKVIFNPCETPVRFHKRVFKGMPFRQSDPSQPMSVADVPQCGELIEPNHPICTVLASGRDEDDIRSNLNDLQARILSGLLLGKQ